MSNTNFELEVPDLGEDYLFQIGLYHYQGYQIDIVLYKKGESWIRKKPVWNKIRKEWEPYKPAETSDEELVEMLNKMFADLSEGLEISIKNKIAADRLWKIIQEFNDSQRAGKEGTVPPVYEN